MPTSVTALHDELSQRLARLRPESPRQWGKMTPHQAICHLLDSQRTALGERSVQSSPLPNWQRQVLRWVALHTPLPWASHPLFGPLSEEEWRRWTYRHFDHHLRQFGC